MTQEAVLKALLKLVGEKGSAGATLHRYAAIDPDHRYESESWSGTLRVELDVEPEPITATVVEARSGEILIQKLRAELKKAIHARAFARKQQSLDAPRRRIGQVLCLEHRP
ncbi:hypothetical protein Pan44_26430 [Caulifigura coniformis]|uniref:Uncharacterized protein n=1 Tax=Caulifigura coniformis TaxID=2527983 RepID=A0A517SER5_9PLAN|nr:hypothetical protein [Caulifigura coniformis]QDT54609.1 hypothetical protein Pan44_26430 [Caulifigura coniformis]